MRPSFPLAPVLARAKSDTSRAGWLGRLGAQKDWDEPAVLRNAFSCAFA